jgi:hypothetical protein
VELKEKVEQLRTKRDLYESQARRFSSLAGRTLGSDENSASEQIQTRLFELLDRCGLGAGKMSLKPEPAKKLSKTEKEVGWHVRVAGTPEQLVDLMYLLESEPYVNSVENVAISTLRRKGQLELKLRFVTLVMTGIHGEEFAADETLLAQATGELDSEQRAVYDVITTRDLFRPYVKREEPPPKTKTAEKPEPGKPEPAPAAKPKPEYRVVSLTTWGDAQEVHVCQYRNGDVKVYTPGESLEGSKIVMIDYRKLPSPDKPEFFSGSRVILEAGGDYWAVELGQKLSEKRKLSKTELPPKLALKAGNSTQNK